MQEKSQHSPSVPPGALTCCCDVCSHGQRAAHTAVRPDSPNRIQNPRRQAMHRYRAAAGLVATLAFAVAPQVAHSARTKIAESAASTTSTKQIERGRYMIVTGNCNICHTAGYAQSEGKVPEKNWLMGNSLGFRGPWGTTYPVNLRLTVWELTEDQWSSSQKRSEPARRCHGSTSTGWRSGICGRCTGTSGIWALRGNRSRSTCRLTRNPNHLTFSSGRRPENKG